MAKLIIDIQFFAEENIHYQSEKSLERGIRSLKKRICEHEEYIKNPRSHVLNWDTLSHEEQQGMIEHWYSEIYNFGISIIRREDELERRRHL